MFAQAFDPISEAMGVSTGGVPTMTFESELDATIAEKLAEKKRAKSAASVGRVMSGAGFVAERASEEIPMPPPLRGGLKVGGIALGVAGEVMTENAQIRGQDAAEAAAYLQSLR